MEHKLIEYKEPLTDKRFVARWSGGRTNQGMKISAERSFALQLIQRNPKLRACSPESVQNCLMDVAYMGLSLSPSLAHVYLIPYKATCTTLISYRGLTSLVYRAGTVKEVQAVLVKANDPVFEVGTNEGGRYIKHTENRIDRGEVTHSYCIAKFTADGGRHIEVMEDRDLRAVEKAATERSERGGAVWRGPFRGEMQKKAVIRRAWKHWPMSAGMVRAMDVMHRAEPVEFAIKDITPRLSPEQISTLTDLCADKDMDTSKLARAFGCTAIDQIPAAKWDEAREILTRKGATYG